MGAHYLRRNERTRTPIRVICIDCEATVRHEPLGSRHTFRLAVASLDVRRDTPRAKARTEWSDHTTKASLWEWVDKRTSTNHTTWLYAHNLEYDLTVSDAWTQLPALGWQVVARAAGGTAPWVRWKRGDRTLIMADLAAWCRRKLSDIGGWVGLKKLRMPPWEASDTRWLRYCRRDVEVLRLAILGLMAWVDEDDLGNWSLSSAGQAWRVFRHRHMNAQLLVHDDDQAQAIERAASFGGRREVFAVGSWSGTRVLDMDFQNHYMTTAGRTRLPRKLAGVLHCPEAQQVESLATSLAVIAEIEVTTDRPCLPVRTAAGIVYPVGQFTTTVAWPEISLALELGASVRYRRAALYQASPLLLPWATWLATQLHGEGKVTDQLRAHVLKSWSRELIGKFGQRQNALTKVGEHQPDRGRLEPFYPAGDRSPVPVLNRSDGVFIADRSQPAENAIPSIFAYVTSAARVALWRALETVGWDNVLTCDTDGFLALSGACENTLVRAAGGRLTGNADAWATGTTWRAADHAHFPGLLAVKASYDQVEILSPEAMVLNGKPKVTGLPSSASRIDTWEFQGEVWPGADWQLQHRGEFDYRTVVRPHLVRSGYTRRQVLDDGTTIPWVAQLVGGQNRIAGMGIEVS